MYKRQVPLQQLHRDVGPDESGSAGTMSAGDLLKERYPHLKLAVGEALSLIHI